jgi:tetratricopeptide (TPR) repeat protein
MGGGAAIADGVELDNGFFKRVYSKETRLSLSEPIPLQKLLDAPKNYKNVYFRSWVRFHREEQLSTPEYTRFNERFSNFSIWPNEARLWVEAERLRDHPFVFAAKDDKLSYQIAQLKKYDLIMIFARVHSDYLGKPWIEVLSIDKEAKATLSDALLTHISVAEALETDGWYREANDEYSRVQSYDLTDDLAAEMWKRKGKNFINAQMPAEASYSLMKSVALAGDDYEAHLWLAESLTLEGKSAKALTAARQALRLRGRVARAYALIGHNVRVLALQELDQLGIDVTKERGEDIKRKREEVRPRYRYGNRRYTKTDVARTDVSYYISQKDKDTVLTYLNTALREGRKAVYLDSTDPQADRWLKATEKAIEEFDARLSKVEGARKGDVKESDSADTPAGDDAAGTSGEK